MYDRTTPEAAPASQRPLTDDEARDLARRIARAVSEPPVGEPAAVLLPQAACCPANETRIDRALVELGLVAPDTLPREAFGGADADGDGG